MFVPYFDFAYLIFSLPALVVGLIATLLLQYWSHKYRNQLNRMGLTGVDAAEKIASAKGFSIRLGITDEFLGDHYDPTSHTLTLSRAVAQEKSIASLGITAHELGHAEQHHQKNILLTLRSAIVPAVQIGTSFGYLLLIAGIILGFAGLAWVGIIMFSAATVFSVITLPVEIDASRRALNMLNQYQLITPAENGAVRKVLFAAALTYVAATLQSVGSLLYFVMQVQGISRRRD